MARRTTTGCAAAAVAALLLAVLSPLPVQAAPTWVLPPAPIPGRPGQRARGRGPADGGALLVYLAATPGADAVWSSDRPPGGTWAEKVQVSDTGGESTEPRVVVDSAGNATAIWRYLGYTASTTVIHAAFRPAGGTWGPPTPLSAATANAFTPDLTVDAAGTVTAVWVIVEGMGVRYVQSATRTLGGAWSAPETRSVGYADEPTVAAGPAGSVVLAYVRQRQRPEPGRHHDTGPLGHLDRAHADLRAVGLHRATAGRDGHRRAGARGLVTLRAAVPGGTGLRALAGRHLVIGLGPVGDPGRRGWRAGRPQPDGSRGRRLAPRGRCL